MFTYKHSCKCFTCYLAKLLLRDTVASECLNKFIKNIIVAISMSVSVYIYLGPIIKDF